MITHRRRQWCAFAALWLVIAAVIVASAVMPRVFAARSVIPTLFYNDSVWVMDDYYPSLGYTIGKMQDFWLPLSFYGEIENIRIRRGTAKNHTVFIIQDTATGKYLSFNINDSAYAQTERSTLILINTMLYSKERYLPMRDMCAYFGWTFEISEDRRSVRICDGKQKRKFSDMLAEYAPPPVVTTEAVRVTEPPVTEPPVTEPVTKPVTKPVDPPVTQAPPTPVTPPVVVPPVTQPPDPPVTEAPPPVVRPVDPPVTLPPVVTEPVTEAVTEPPKEKIYRAASVYLTFEDIDGVHTPMLLDTLAEYGAHAVFFVSGEQLTQHTDVVLRILAEGHKLGLHGMTDDEYSLWKTDDLLAALDEENALLYALVRQKTRLVRMPEGSRSGRLYLSDEQKSALSARGYVLWDWNISAMDHDDDYDADRVLEKIDAALKVTYYPVIRMHCSETAAQVLPVLLQRLSDADTAVQLITEATAAVVFP